MNEFMKNFSLEGKIAFVTGASYGIGFAIASAYAAAGATIVFNDINQELVNKGLAAYEEKGIKVGLYNEVSSGMKMSLSAMDILSVLSQGYTLMTSGADFVEFRIPQDGTYSYGSVGSSSVLDVRWKTNKTRFHALMDDEQ